MREFWNALEGYYERTVAVERLAWERTRWSTCALINIQLKREDRLRPTDLITFDWERQPADPAALPTKEDFERMSKLGPKIAAITKVQ